MMEPLDAREVPSVYSGRNGKCCCGCSGQHYYAKAHQKWATKNRGYKVTDDEVNDGQVTRIVNIINKADAVDDSVVYRSTIVGNRIYIAYKLHD